LREVLEQIRQGDDVHDKEFDRFLLSEARAFSKIYWTPIAVARRAAELLVDGPETRVLDVGSGAGKFCLIGALTAKAQAHFTGVEQNQKLVTMAKSLGQRCAIANATFICGDALALDWREWDAYYLFNPFAAEFSASTKSIHAHAIAGERHVDMVNAAMSKLDRAPSGTKAAIYWGIGDRLPPSWAHDYSESFGSGSLEIWVKR
jgi:SAM-dependent methyltransferase